MINEPVTMISVINKLWEQDDTISQPPCEYLGVRNPFFATAREQTCNYTWQLFELHLDEKIRWN